MRHILRSEDRSAQLLARRDPGAFKNSAFSCSALGDASLLARVGPVQLKSPSKRGDVRSKRKVEPGREREGGVYPSSATQRFVALRHASTTASSTESRTSAIPGNVVDALPANA